MSMDFRAVTGLETEGEDCILQAIAVASKEGEVLVLDHEVGVGLVILSLYR